MPIFRIPRTVFLLICVFTLAAALVQGQTAPTISYLTPNAGAPGTSITVTVVGSNFVSNTLYSRTTIYAGTPISVGPTTYINSNQVSATFTIPSSAASQSVSVVVTTTVSGDGTFTQTSNTVPFQITCTASVGGGATIPGSGGKTTFYMTTTPACGWSLQGIPSWASCSPSSGIGSADISCTAGANSGAARAAQLTLLDQSFLLNQAAGSGNTCNITGGVSTRSISVLPSGGSGVIAVNAATGCTWTASSNSSFLTISSGASGSGNGTVQWSVSTNGGSAKRTAALTIQSANSLTQGFSQTGSGPVSLGISHSVEIVPPGGSRAPVTTFPAISPASRGPDAPSQPVAAGSVLRFSETTTNRGTGNSTTTTTCNLDSSISPQACSVTTGGTCGANGSSVTGDNGTLGAGQSSTMSVTAVVQVNLPNGKSLSTTCRTDSSQGNGTADDSTLSVPLFVVDPATPVYALGLTLAPIGTGSISTYPVSSTSQFLQGSTVELTAIPAPGYQFTGWSGDLTGTTNPQTVTMSAARNVKANFAPLPDGAMRFVPLAPCRVLDTRNAAGPFGGPAIVGGSTRDFPITASSCGVPSTALAYSLNITVVPQGNLGYLTVWPTGQPQPYVSTLNSDGRFKANAAIVPAGDNGSIRAFATDTTHLVVDINGYFVPVSANDPNGLQFYPLTPCRISDTRDPVGTYGGPALAGGQVRSVPVAGKCGVPSNAKAYSLNMTAVPQGFLGYLTVWPTGQSQPFVSTLNSPNGVNLANAAIVPAGTNGSINLFVSNTSHMVMDVNGYFAAPGGSGALSFYSFSPCRIADTRNSPSRTFAGPILSAGEIRTYPISQSTCGVPSTAQAYVFNATVVPQGSLGYLTLYPAGVGVPGSSTLNAPDGTITANAAIVPAGTNNGVNVFTLNGTHFLLDISGYFAP